ncbi:MAG: hypothetical protein L0206_24355, partial [Actinobacteria bacterium]|nr:hypothetical protein [Actinomycetota bacterium]
LGNPVDIALDGEELRVAEKENNLLLLFTDVFSHDGGDVAPRLSILSDSPESMVLEPDVASIGPDVSDIDDSSTALDGLLVTSNPVIGALEVGDIRRLDLALTETAFFEAVFELENVTLDRNGDACVTFDDGGAGGILFVNRLAKGRDGETLTDSRDRQIMGASTLLVSPKGVEVVDQLGRVLVAENNAAAPSILVFSSSAMDDAVPLEVTELPAQPWDLDYDPAGDRLFIAMTDGSVAVYDAYFNLPVPAVPDRVITISDGGVVPVQESVNLHGIVYDASNDTLIVTDVGDIAVDDDGVIYTIDAASTADGLTAPTVRIAGASTLLGNPVDVAYNGQDLFVAEKLNGLVLRFNDVLTSAGGDIAPDDSVLHVAPESVVLVPSNLSPTSGGSIF